MNAQHHVAKHQREAHEATDEVLLRLEGLINALDLIEDKMEFPDEKAPHAKAFRTLRPLMAEKMEQIWDMRQAEWEALGGN